jgi:hypothetical protein
MNSDLRRLLALPIPAALLEHRARRDDRPPRD